MKQLLQGMESRQKIDTLLAMTKIAPGPKVEAIYYHLVQGAGQSRAAMAFSVKQSKLSEALATLNEQAEHCERYHELKVHQPDTNKQRNARIEHVVAECSGDEAVAAINKIFEGVPA